MRARGRLSTWAALAALAGCLAAGGQALAEVRYAPVDRPGPPLDVSRKALAESLRCTASVRRATRQPILLVPGTTLTPAANFSWNYERAFRALRFPYCTVRLPERANGDIQTAAEYLVYAIRRAHRASGRRVDVLGYSQGGMVPRWALRFWPGTRALVDDDIGLDASNHGTLDAEYCSPLAGGCPAAFWQQRRSARFIAALNSIQETFPGVSYTEVYSRTDEVVTPNLGPAASSAVHGPGRIANVAVQEICPGDLSEHLAMGTYDPVGFALALDALTHPGPARPARIPVAVCAQAFQPGVDPATFPRDYAAFLGFIARSIAGAERVGAEPPLRCYVFAAGCP